MDDPLSGNEKPVSQVLTRVGISLEYASCSRV